MGKVLLFVFGFGMVGFLYLFFFRWYSSVVNRVIDGFTKIIKK